MIFSFFSIHILQSSPSYDYLSSEVSKTSSQRKTENKYSQIESLSHMRTPSNHLSCPQNLHRLLHTLLCLHVSQKIIASIIPPSFTRIIRLLLSPIHTQSIDSLIEPEVITFLKTLIRSSTLNSLTHSYTSHTLENPIYPQLKQREYTYPNHPK
jgi:hypothetical protein